MPDDKSQDVFKRAAAQFAVISTDHNGLIHSFNPQAEALLGFKADDLIGKKHANVFLSTSDLARYLPEDAPELTKPQDALQALHQKVASAGRHQEQCHLLSKNGDMIPVELAISSIGADGQAGGLLFMVNPAEQPNSDISLADLPDETTFTKILDREWRRCHRQQKPMSLLKLDLDHFKAYVDQVGDVVAQQTLQDVAQAFDARVQRAGDVLCYTAFDEFFVIVPFTDLPGAVKLAEYLRMTLAGLEIPHEQSKDKILSVSVGIATLEPSSNNSQEQLLEFADTALQSAKKAGRNCARIAENH
jgi:diguanylate cyclase (GGDEF)-like protein/PAS domain S-box-containing protein